MADEVAEVRDFLVTEAVRPWCTTTIIPSNHHEAMLRWLKDARWQDDPVNAVFYHEAWLALLNGCEDIFQWALNKSQRNEADFLRLAKIDWLKDDEPFILAGVEVGQHGHLGINGSRGNHKSFSRLGRPATTGHEHTAGIHLWNWVSGTCTKLRIGYNRGPSSWSHSHTVLYPEGTRSIVTMWKGRWRA